MLDFGLISLQSTGLSQRLEFIHWSIINEHNHVSVL